MTRVLKLVIVLAAIAMVGKVCYDGGIAFNKSAHASVVEDLKTRKGSCLEEFDTIPCHQLRIEHLLRESRRASQ